MSCEALTPNAISSSSSSSFTLSKSTEHAWGDELGLRRRSIGLMPCAEPASSAG